MFSPPHLLSPPPLPLLPRPAPSLLIFLGLPCSLVSVLGVQMGLTGPKLSIILVSLKSQLNGRFASPHSKIGSARERRESEQLSVSSPPSSSPSPSVPQPRPSYKEMNVEMLAVHTAPHSRGRSWDIRRREVVMQYLMAMLRVGDQKVKKEIRCRQWDGGVYSSG